MQGKSIATFIFGVVLAVSIGPASAAPGDADTTLVPITPCRAMDTRSAFRVGSQSAFTPNSTKTIRARGTIGQCNIPATATALALNVTAIDATEPTFLTVWPGGGRPNASSLNPVPGQPPTPNGVIAALAADGSFQMYNLAGSVDVIVDVAGYYTKSSLQNIEARLKALEGSNAAPSPSGFSARITGYGPVSTITSVSGDVTNGLDVEASVRVDVVCPNGTVETDNTFSVPPGQTRGFEVLCDGVFTDGATVRTVRI